ncbi:phosphatidylserine/phosphatidylglycerophosphate/ cardiolipin synthase [Cryptosporidium canis]|uniref:Phosphatidylserine/phosphatidylglycerophosphate/ cardiolipin synthase n=1 Tax=Cryptosporidium canis TaxID=195482 RepID=A0ABQ8P696_9CRYT|nr:phosphatidylserine/phosphatidylglycerophosphate/ cardiolipin synthase [Cryptosporidium canis]KAJ1612678.1 phosphatidylserine/phosphatidylglycerophosphate/ cardiolipin synthase [Cryptosporidium canis]
MKKEKNDFISESSKKSEQWLIDEVNSRIAERNNIFNISEDVFENQKWFHLLSSFSSYGRITKGNNIKLFDNSRDAYLSMINSIDMAIKRVWFETYIFEECDTGELFIESLCKASDRGCEVILLLDAFGSYNFPRRWEQKLIKNNVKVIWFNPISRILTETFLFRNHRKLLITDEKAFCGSINITNRINNSSLFDEANIQNLCTINYSLLRKLTSMFKLLIYSISPFRIDKPFFYDVHAEIDGPATYDLAEVFIDSLKESKCNYIPTLFQRPHEIVNGITLQVLYSNTRRQHRGIQKVLTAATKNASNCIHLTTSYFFPPGFLCKAIQIAINNNVKVSMLLSGRSDIPGDTIATKYLIKRFLHNNARFFFTRNFHCHAKYITIDGIWSSFGSFNWDGLSANRNLEVSVASFDPKVAYRLMEMQSKMTHSFQSTEQTIHKWREQSKLTRIGSKVAYVIIRFINKSFI